MSTCGEDIIVKRGYKKTLRFWSSEEENFMQVEEVLPQRNDPSALLKMFKVMKKTDDVKPSEGRTDGQNNMKANLRNVQEIKGKEDKQTDLLIKEDSQILLHPDSRIDNSAIDTKPVMKLNKPVELLIQEEPVVTENAKIKKNTVDDNYDDDGGEISLMSQNSEDLFNSKDVLFDAIKKQMVQNIDRITTIADDLVYETSTMSANVNSQTFTEVEVLIDETTTTEKLSDETIEAENLLEETTEAKKLVDETTKAKQFVDETTKAEKLVDETTISENLVDETTNAENLIEENTEVENLVDETIKVENLVDETIKVENLVDETIKVENLVDETVKVEDLVDETIKVENLVDETTKAENSIEENTEVENLVDETTRMENLVIETTMAEKLIDETTKVENLTNETTRIENLVDEISKGQNLIDETTKIENLDYETTRVENLVDETTRVENLVDETIREENLVDETTKAQKFIDETTMIENLVDENVKVEYLVDETTRVEKLIDETTTNTVESVDQIDKNAANVLDKTHAEIDQVNRMNIEKPASEINIDIEESTENISKIDLQTELEINVGSEQIPSENEKEIAISQFLLNKIQQTKEQESIINIENKSNIEKNVAIEELSTDNNIVTATHIEELTTTKSNDVMIAMNQIKDDLFQGSSEILDNDNESLSVINKNSMNSENKSIQVVLEPQTDFNEEIEDNDNVVTEMNINNISQVTTEEPSTATIAFQNTENSLPKTKQNFIENKETELLTTQQSLEPSTVILTEIEENMGGEIKTMGKPDEPLSQHTEENVISITDTIVRLIENSLGKQNGPERSENLYDKIQVVPIKIPKLEDLISIEELEKKINQVNIEDEKNLEQNLQEILTTSSGIIEGTTLSPEISTILSELTSAVTEITSAVPELSSDIRNITTSIPQITTTVSDITAQSLMSSEKKETIELVNNKSTYNEAALRQKLSEILSKLNDQKNSGNYDFSSLPLEIYPEDIGFTENKLSDSKKDTLNANIDEIKPITRDSNAESDGITNSTTTKTTSLIPDLTITNDQTSINQFQEDELQPFNNKTPHEVVKTPVIITYVPQIENLSIENQYASIDVTQFKDILSELNDNLNILKPEQQQQRENLIMPSVKSEEFDEAHLIQATDDIEDKETLFESTTPSIVTTEVQLESKDNMTSNEKIIEFSNIETTTGTPNISASNEENSVFIKDQEMTTITPEDPFYNWESKFLEIDLLEKLQTRINIDKQDVNKQSQPKENIDIKVNAQNDLVTDMANDQEIIDNYESSTVNSATVTNSLVIINDLKESAINEDHNTLNQLNMQIENDQQLPESTTLVTSIDIEDIIPQSIEKEAANIKIAEDSTNNSVDHASSVTVSNILKTDLDVLKEGSIFSKETGSQNVLSLIRDAIKKNLASNLKYMENENIRHTENQNIMTIPFAEVQNIRYTNPVVIKEYQSQVVISTPKSVDSSVSQTEASIPNITTEESSGNVQATNINVPNIDILAVKDKDDQNQQSSEPMKDQRFQSESKIDVTTLNPEEITVTTDQTLGESTTVMYESSSQLSESTSSKLGDNDSKGKLTEEGNQDSSNFLKMLEKYIIDDSPSESYVPEEIYNSKNSQDNHVNNPVNDYFFNYNHNYGDINRKISLDDNDNVDRTGNYDGPELFKRKQDNSPPYDIYEEGISQGPSLSSLLQTRKGYVISREPSNNPQSSLRRDDSQYPYGGEPPFYIKLPGTPSAVPVFLQYEPVKINYVSPDEMLSRKNSKQNQKEEKSSIQNEVIPDQYQPSFSDRKEEDLYSMGPDPFFLMDPPDLGGDNENEINLVSSQTNKKLPNVKESFSVDLKSQLNFNRKTSNFPSTITGSNPVYPGEYFLKTPDNSYTSSDTESLTNSVFSLGSKVTIPPTNNDNPQYTPFPLTTNPPKRKVVSSTTAFEESTLSPFTLPLQILTTSATKMDSVNISTESTQNMNSSTTNGDTPSIVFSPAPSIDYNNSYDAISSPDLPSEKRTLDNFALLNEENLYNEEMEPHAEKIVYPNQDEEFDIVALVNLLHQNQNVWSSSNVSPILDDIGTWRSPSWADDSSAFNSPIRDNTWIKKDYSAFYSPEDIPGLEPNYFFYNQMSPDSNRAPRTLAEEVLGIKSYIDSLPLPLKKAVVGETKSVHVKKRSIPDGDKIYCEWNFKTDPGLYLLVTFSNLSAPFTIDCFGAYIEVERESNGYGARWCGNRASPLESRQHVIFAKHQVRISVFDDIEIQKNHPTGFEAEIEAIDLFDSEDYNSFIKTKANPRIRRLMQG